MKGMIVAALAAAQAAAGFWEDEATKWSDFGLD